MFNIPPDHTLRSSTSILGKAILYSLKITEDVVVGVFVNVSLARRPLQAEKDAIASAEANLHDARYAAEDDLQRAIDDSNAQRQTTPTSFQVIDETSSHYLFITSLLLVCGSYDIEVNLTSIYNSRWHMMWAVCYSLQHY